MLSVKFFVATEYPETQQLVMKFLQSQYNKVREPSPTHSGNYIRPCA